MFVVSAEFPQSFNEEEKTGAEIYSILNGIGPSVEDFGKQNQVTIMWFSMILIVVFYSGLIVFGCHNTYRYIIKQKKYRNVPLLLFYLFAILACAARLTRYIAMIYDFT